jgi:hypothetical protein
MLKAPLSLVIGSGIPGRDEVCAAAPSTRATPAVVKAAAPAPAALRKFLREYAMVNLPSAIKVELQPQLDEPGQQNDGGLLPGLEVVLQLQHGVRVQTADRADRVDRRTSFRVPDRSTFPSSSRDRRY